MTMQLDDKQSLAAESLAKSMIVTAGAGSGKTRVLVERYIRLITKQVDGGLAGPERVIAITFTEKAASEMRSRVESALMDRIRSAKNEDEAISLKAIMERLPQARISTIDSFCMNLVRKYPLHAGAHPEFSVLEPGDAESIRYDSLKEALDSVVSKLSADEKEEFGQSIIDACGTLTKFIRVMEARMASCFTTGIKAYNGTASGVSKHITAIRDRAINIYEERLGKIKALDFALIEDKAVKLLSGEMGGEIRKGIDFVLVDEYQDINTMQDTLVRQLISQPGASVKEIIGSGKLFMVGDLKQSIYRFRGAEPRIFERWVEEAKSSGNYVNLDNNYRSNPVLIGFINRLFGKVLGEGFQSSQAGRMRFEANGGALVHVMASPKEERMLLYDKIAEKVLDIVGKQFGRNKDDTVRRMSFKDIALLSPSNAGIDPYAEAFSRHGIPVVIYKSGTFYQSEVVAFIISFLATTMNDTDEIAAYQLLASPAYCIREASLASLSINTRSISSALCVDADLRQHFLDDEEYEDFLRARKAILKCRSVRNSYSSREILELLTEEHFLERDILLGYGRRGVANFRKLIEISSNAALALGNLVDFFKHLETYRNRGIQVDEPNILDDDEDAVKLMTIHKAKGLEFPVVILGEGNIDMESKIDGDETAIVQLEDGRLMLKVGEDQPSFAEYSSKVQELQRLNEEEKKRLLYVATTRAEELLVISGSEASKVKEKTGTGYKRKPNYFFSKLGEATSDGGVADMVWDDDMNLVPCKTAAKEKADGNAVQDEDLALHMLARSNDRIVRFSPSSIMSYLSCPKEYLRRHWYRLPEADSADFSTRTDAKGKYRSADLGTIVHYIAQNVEGRDDLQQALEGAQAAFEGKMKRSQALREKVKSLAENYCGFIEENKGSGKVMKEVTFSLKINEYYLEGIMDRLEDDGSGGWIITDLKTNNLDNRHIDELRDKYEIQLHAYRLASARVLGTDRVKARLLFLMNNTVVDQQDVDIDSIEDKLYGIMRSASMLPERHTDLISVCKDCEKAGTCHEQALDDYGDDMLDEQATNLSEEISN